MPALRTEVTEVVTGLGMLGHADPDVALQHKPAQLLNVDDEVWARVAGAWQDRTLGHEFHAAWANGAAFLRAPGALRGRVPARVEWKGRHRPPGYELIPADLRVDHVYLVSCKYLSKILINASPASLFDHGLGYRPPGAGDWYQEVAPQSHQELYAECVAALGLRRLPDRVGDLDRAQRAELRAALTGGWPAGVAEIYRQFAADVSERSAERWAARLATPAAREEMVWRLLRLQSAPYFVLGTSDQDTLRVRVGTPWDWRQRFRLTTFEVWGDKAGQPRVGWAARVTDLEDGEARTVEGHVEVRWSHGRFAQAPEAKVYLDTPHRHVPGYFPL